MQLVPLRVGASSAASTADAALFSNDDSVKAYQGGSFKHLHAMLGVSTGNQVLYVGDHIYGDILRSKKTLGWRTMLVVPELAHEMECLERAEEAGFPQRLRRLRQRRDRLADALQLAAGLYKLTRGLKAPGSQPLRLWSEKTGFKVCAFSNSTCTATWRRGSRASCKRPWPSRWGSAG
jgi:hypothetical protein